MKQSLLFLISLFFHLIPNKVYTQTLTTPPNGIADPAYSLVAFINATIQTDADQILREATLLIEGDQILRVGTSVAIPENARIIDLKGKWIFPGFIDLHSHYGVPKAAQKKKSNRPVFASDKIQTSYWNEAIHPELNAASVFNIDKTKASALRSAGFSIALSHQQNGIARGSSVLVNLGEQKPVLKDQAGMHYSFSKGNSKQDYPRSLMGSIALLRQLFTDFDWYRFHTESTNISLEAMKRQHRLPMFFESRDYQESIRAQALAKESGRSFILIGTGDEYKDLEGLRLYNSKVVVPVKPHKAIQLNDIQDYSRVSLDQLRNWKYAASNAYFLSEAGIPFSISYRGCSSNQDFFSGLRASVSRGLGREKAIRALTTTPASWIGLSKQYGKIEAGYKASFFISDKDVFTDKATILQSWIDGKAYTYQDLQIPNLAGKYEIYEGADTFVLRIKGGASSPSAKMGMKGKDLQKAIVKWDALSIRIMYHEKAYQGHYTDTGFAGYLMVGNVKRNWVSKRLTHSDHDFNTSSKTVYSLPDRKPFVYGSEATDFIIKNCTVWTCSEDGIVPRLDVYVKNGKIHELGENLNYDGVQIIDGTGMHLTPGLVDEHSHIAIKRGVNEGSQSVTAEVRIEDVINADDINLYRQVAGGVTSSHLLHGSANPIGGQTALIKLRYGAPYRDLKFGNDHRFIKFALGENVKQSNWGDRQTTRFPQTRMGVEQVFQDAFTRAKSYSDLRKKDQVKIDWELEALKEILDGKRHITCHSYQQGEINMLMHVADSHGFRVNTFTHILEGYKVADKLKKHGAAASTFSDWWAYKFEVNDAIPFNAALLQKQGVLTGINSDDAEMGRRLNQEAAKAVKYGGVSEEDALKMVTINPAKMLHIDNRVGSIAVGKDADLVLWNGHPLSNYSKVHTTWIEGTVYFNLITDQQERERLQKEKQQLIQEMRASKGSKKKFKKQETPEYHCDSMEVY